MRILSKGTLRKYWESHPDCKDQLLTWYKETAKTVWGNFEDIKKRHATCKIVGSNRVVFKIKGNHHRLIVKINFDQQIVWIRFIGTHSDYDKINAETM